jgi:3-dehydroquinate synthase
VGCGMVMAADLSMHLGLITAEYAQRILTVVERAGLPTVGPPFGANRYLELMRLDKKSEASTIRFVVIDSPGRARLTTAPDELVGRVLYARSG